LKITIVTVAFNSAETIGDTLKSVAAQTYADIEHIVIDGASKDGTVDLVRAQGSRVARLVSEPDRGIYDAMNKGLALASGDFVGFLNADDMLASSGVLHRSRRPRPTADIDAVCGDLVYVRKDRPDAVVRYWRCGAFARSRLRFGWMPPHPTLYVRRSRLPELGGFDTRLRIAADYDFMLRCLNRLDMQVAYVPAGAGQDAPGRRQQSLAAGVLRKSREEPATPRTASPPAATR
jgi:glycosyltransferase